MANAHDSRLMRKVLQRELGMRNIMEPGDRLRAAWAVGLLSLTINGVDVTAREAGRRYRRVLRPSISNASGLGLLDKQMVLQTPGHMYSAIAGLIYGIRTSGQTIELAWHIPKPEPGSPEAALIPASELDGTAARFAIVHTKVDAYSDTQAEHISEQVIERRTYCLSLLDPDARANSEGHIERYTAILTS